MPKEGYSFCALGLRDFQLQCKDASLRNLGLVCYQEIATTYDYDCEDHDDYTTTTILRLG